MDKGKDRSKDGGWEEERKRKQERRKMCGRINGNANGFIYFLNSFASLAPSLVPHLNTSAFDMFLLSTSLAKNVFSFALMPSFNLDTDCAILYGMKSIFTKQILELTCFLAIRWFHVSVFIFLFKPDRDATLFIEVKPVDLVQCSPVDISGGAI